MVYLEQTSLELSTCRPIHTPAQVASSGL